MGGINMPRVFLGGFVAAVVMFVLEGLGSLAYFDDMRSALEDHGLSAEMSPGAYLIPVLVTLIAGFVMIWFYAAVRPRLGPGPRTAALVGFMLWFGGYLLSLLGYAGIGLFPVPLLTIWAIVGLVEIVLAAIAGAWIYKEG